MISYGALIWDDKQLKISSFKMDLGFNGKNQLLTCIRIFDAVQMWSPRNPWIPQSAEFWSPGEKKEAKGKNWMFISTQGLSHKCSPVRELATPAG